MKKALIELETWAYELPQPARSKLLVLLTAAGVALDWSWGLVDDEVLQAALLELEEALA